MWTYYYTIFTNCGLNVGGRRLLIKDKQRVVNNIDGFLFIILRLFVRLEFLQTDCS